MPSDDNGLAAKIEEIRQMFLQRLHDEWLPRIGDLRRRLPLDWNKADVDDTVFLTHSLAGSGATFGYPAITDLGRKVEIAARTMQKDATAATDEARADILSGLARLEQEGRAALADLRT
jgi:HPt (histidine-containing phosphotransfer) domain-containing protein